MESTADRLRNDLLEASEERERRVRRRAVVYTLIPAILTLVLILVSSFQVVRASRELEAKRQQLAAVQQQLDKTQNSLAEARAEVDSLRATRDEAADKLGKIVSLTRELEMFVERKESFLRSLDEARFLIAIRRLFDRIDREFRAINPYLPEEIDLSRGRVWTTIVQSSSSLEDLRRLKRDWAAHYHADDIAIYRAPNNLFALALKGDGTFTEAYRLTVEVQNNGLSPGAYFAAAQDWGQDLSVEED